MDPLLDVTCRGAEVTCYTGIAELVCHRSWHRARILVRVELLFPHYLPHPLSLSPLPTDLYPPRPTAGRQSAPSAPQRPHRHRLLPAAIMCATKTPPLVGRPERQRRLQVLPTAIARTATGLEHATTSPPSPRARHRLASSSSRLRRLEVNVARLGLV